MPPRHTRAGTRLFLLVGRPALLPLLRWPAWTASLLWRPLEGGVVATIFRIVLVACQTASIIISWPVWHVRANPPMLPMLPVPQVDVGPLLIGSLVLCVLAPRVGIFVHIAVLIAACIADQTRLQPEFGSLALLLLGTLPSYALRFVAINHLISLWWYAGFNKLLSQPFLTSTADWMLEGFRANPLLRQIVYLPFTQTELLRGRFGYMIVAVEISLALLAIFPRTRKLCATLAVLVHLGIFLVLSPLGHDWNAVVLPWNIALALAGLSLILPWREPFMQAWRLSHPAVRVFAVVLWLYPAGFYLGISDAYLAHNLYASNAPTEQRCNPQGGCVANTQASATWKAFNVPLPPEPRLFTAYFQASCQPGERLVILDKRPGVAWWGTALHEIACDRQ